MISTTIQEPQQEVRCPNCNRLLFKVVYNVIGDLRLEIVCPKSKCGELVIWPVMVPEIGERRVVESVHLNGN